MTYRISWLRTVCVAGAIGCLAANAYGVEARSMAAALDSVTASDLRRHVDFLAGDALEGREAGTRGGQAAGGYLIDQLRKLGLHGGGVDGAFHQPVPTGGRNILALMPGSDERLKKEVIVVSAHYDHVGYGSRRNSFGPTGYIHNGADDNASGTSGLLELAEALTKLPQAPRRSILLAWWDGEEAGLYGSKHWVGNPTISRDRVVFMFNMDMIGRLRNDHVEVTGTRTALGLRRLLSRANAATSLALDFQWEVKGNSDHYPFFEVGIPIVMLHTGLHDDYHRPSDDVEKINSDGMQRVARLMLTMLLETADADRLPSFRAAGRQETTEDGRRQFERPSPPPAARLGVIWDEKRRDGGLRLIQVDAGSAADEAGLRVGDRLVAFNERPIADDEDFRSWVLAAKSAINLGVRRGENSETRTVPVSLRGDAVRLGVAWRGDSAEPGTVMVTQVYRASPVGRAGLQVGDRIYAVGGQEFRDSDDFQRVVTAQTSPFELVVERKGRIQTLTVRGVSPVESAPSATEP